ncbi:DUF1659 domain-containing protein [Pseudogracilibacillus auburnensis]|uniref:DUF1659 domain-containing protein n=1 Tax=Pseudogracilibacillus auburnensis TaxID=1494959 RepID=UPI000D775A8F|nr:DUF1659 domain-containing protein [Pseudogracilibacillus auburnensis]
MATSTLMKSQVRLVLENGKHSTSGNPIFKTKSFNNVKTDASPTQLFAVATALANLQTLPLHSVERFDHSEIEGQ